MQTHLPKLTANLRKLSRARREVVITADEAARARLQLSFIVLESGIAKLLDGALEYLGIKKAPPASSGPIITAASRVIALPSRPVAMSFVGTSLVVQETVWLGRTLTLWDRLFGTSKNAPAIVWSAVDTTSVVEDLVVSAQVLKDVGRLLDAFAKDWRAANE